MSKPAGFLLRLIASTIDGQLFFFFISVTFFFYSSSQNLNQLLHGILIFLIILLIFPLVPIYVSFFTSYFYGPLGKLLTGLRVLDKQGLALSLKRSFFRHTIGYSFSGILFGLGFLAIIKDPQKLAWHDKAVGSKVIINKPLWPLGLLILVSLLAVNIFLVSGGIRSITANENIKNEFNSLINELKSTQIEKNTKQLPQDQADLNNDSTPYLPGLMATPSASTSQ